MEELNSTYYQEDEDGDNGLLYDSDILDIDKGRLQKKSVTNVTRVSDPLPPLCVTDLRPQTPPLFSPQNKCV